MELSFYYTNMQVHVCICTGMTMSMDLDVTNPIVCANVRVFMVAKHLSEPHKKFSILKKNCNQGRSDQIEYEI